IPWKEEVHGSRQRQRRCENYQQRSIGASRVKRAAQDHRANGCRRRIECPGNAVKSGESAQAKIASQQVRCNGRFAAGPDANQRRGKATRRKTICPGEKENTRRGRQAYYKGGPPPEKPVQQPAFPDPAEQARATQYGRA